MTQENNDNALITEDYVSFEIAKLLEEKGFDEYCMYFYTLKDEGCEGYKSNRTLGEFAHNSHPDLKGRAVSCPTLQMAMKWLREKYHIEILIEPFSEDENFKTTAYIFNYWYRGKYHIPYQEDGILAYKTWKTHEEASMSALEYCLEKINCLE